MDGMADSYPANWDKIAVDIKTRAGWCCENCGHPNSHKSGHVLTVHHLDGNKGNCEYDNLVALCQRCHLSIQARYVPGQLWLFDPPVWATNRGLDAASNAADSTRQSAQPVKSSTR